MFIRNNKLSIIYKTISCILIFVFSLDITAQTAIENSRIYYNNSNFNKENISPSIYLAPKAIMINPVKLDFYQRINDALDVYSLSDLPQSQAGNELNFSEIKDKIQRKFSAKPDLELFSDNSQFNFKLKNVYFSEGKDKGLEIILVIERMGVEIEVKILRKTEDNLTKAIAENSEFIAVPVNEISEKFFFGFNQNDYSSDEIDKMEKPVSFIPALLITLRKVMDLFSISVHEKTTSLSPLKKIAGALILAMSLISIQATASMATEYNFNFADNNANISITPERWDSKLPQNETLDKISREIAGKLNNDLGNNQFSGTVIKKLILEQNNNIGNPDRIYQGTEYKLKVVLTKIEGNDITDKPTLVDNNFTNFQAGKGDVTKHETVKDTGKTSIDLKDHNNTFIPLFVFDSANKIFDSINELKMKSESSFSNVYNTLIESKERLLKQCLFFDLINYELACAGFVSLIVGGAFYNYKKAVKTNQIKDNKQEIDCPLIHISSPEKDKSGNIILKIYSSFSPRECSITLNKADVLSPSKSYRTGNAMVSVFMLNKSEGEEVSIELKAGYKGEIFTDNKKFKLVNLPLEAKDENNNLSVAHEFAKNDNREINEVNLSSVKMMIVSSGVFLSSLLFYVLYNTFPPLGILVAAVYFYHQNLLAGILFNEIGHLISGLPFLKKWITKENAFANLSGLSWLLNFLTPFLGFYFFKNSPHVKINNFEENKTSFAEYFTSSGIQSFIRKGGLLIGGLLSIVWYAVLNKTTELLPEYLFINAPLLSITGMLGLITAFIMSAYSDLKSIQIPWHFFCGNFGIMVSSKFFDNKKSIDIVQPMIQTTAVRGKQAGGIAAITNLNSQLFKIVNSKRGQLDVKLINQLKKVLSPQKNENSLILGHVRYGTSSAPSIEATHPHTFSGENNRIFWSKTAAGKFIKKNVKLVNYITHNGDYTHHNFSKQYKFGKNLEKVGLDKVNSWLRNILNPNEAPGDSVNIAGMIELTHTQNMWYPSLRLAFYQTLARNMEEFISKDDLNKIASFADEAMEFICNDANFNIDKDFGFLEKMIFEAIQKNLNGLSSFQPYSVQEIKDFINQAMGNFMHADLFDALNKFSEVSMGTFGLFAASSLYPDRIVGYAKGQPLAFGFSDKGMMAWGSEPAALKILDEDKNPLFRYHYYFDEVGGEVIEIRDNPEKKSFSFKGNSHMSGVIHDIKELIATGRLVDTKENTLINPIRKYDNPDLIETDRFEISEILKKVKGSFEEKGSLNNQTSLEFSNSIFGRVKAPPPSGLTQELDVLILGEETSLFHAESFASSLAKLFPLNVRAVSANSILSTDSNIDIRNKTIFIDNSKGSGFTITENTVVLAVSHSGQTFSTFHVTNLLSKINKNVFALTGEIDSQIGRAIGQKYFKNAPFSKHIFTNMAGYRPSEASTISSVATSHTLTEILLSLLDEANKKYPAIMKNYSKLSGDEIKIIKKERDYLINNEIPSLLNNNSEKIKQIQSEAKRWAMDIIEPEIVLLGSITLVFSTVLLGISPIPFLAAFSGLGFLMQFYKYIKGEASFLKMSSSFLTTIFILMLDIYHPRFLGLNLSDAIAYSTLVFTLPLFLRLLQNRHLLDRIFGTRNLVISDSPPVQKLLHSLVSKLFASSYEIASIITHSSKPNNIPHFFGHQVSRGVRTWIGMNRKNFASQSKELSARSMNVNQILGIKNLNGGAEVLTFGHDNKKNTEFSRNININVNEKENSELLNILKTNIDAWGQLFDFSDEEKKELQFMLIDSLENFYGSYKEPYLIAKAITDRVFPLKDEQIKNGIIKALTAYLERQRSMEKFLENRFENLHRYIGGITFFDAMAKFVANPPWYLFPLRMIFGFFRWLSHNGTRIATTASPQSADDILNIVELLEREKLKQNERELTDVTDNKEEASLFELIFDDKNKEVLKEESLKQEVINNKTASDIIPEKMKSRVNNLIKEIFPSFEDIKLLEELYALLPQEWEAKKETIKELAEKYSNEERKQLILFFSLRTAIIPKWKIRKDFKKILRDLEIDGETFYNLSNLTHFENDFLKYIKEADESSQIEFIKHISISLGENEKTLKSDYKVGLKDLTDKINRLINRPEKNIDEALRVLDEFSNKRPGILAFFMLSKLSAENITFKSNKEISLLESKNKLLQKAA